MTRQKQFTFKEMSSLFFFCKTANASKVYASAVAKTQKTWGPYLEAIMKVVHFVATKCCHANEQRKTKTLIGTQLR